MGRTFVRCCLLLVLALAAWPAAASAQTPAWCGTPEADASLALDGFPHIPYYAIGCTLEDIEERSRGRMDVRVIGRSSTGRDMYGVVINRLRTSQERRDFRNWIAVRSLALKDPAKAQRLLDRFGDDVKVPIFVQGGIHGNEYEGVDSAMDMIEKYATTPFGEDPEVDRVLRHSILIFNPIQNPDGRVAGTRRNANGFDLNRDYLTQSQSETRASVSLMKKWLPPEVLDLHGYVSPTLIEATTKPHNPSIEYDLWLKWNQPRIDANEAAVNAIGKSVQRPINDWCEDTTIPPPGQPCPGGTPPGPAVAEGWDDWGPFYTAMYAQHLGLDSSTVEMCEPFVVNGQPTDPECGGRAGARDVQTAVQESTFQFVVDNREDMLFDELEIYRRGDVDAPRPSCCPPPFDVDNNWMIDYPKAYVIPLGEGQRSDAEANRLVEWLLFNDIEVTELERDYRFGGQTFEEGSYVAWIAQPRRGLLDTAMSLGVDISDRISILYAPPAAWSHGYLWGADVVTIPDGAAFSPRTDRIRRPNRLDGGLENGSGRPSAYALEIDSPTAVRAVNELVRGGAVAWFATEAFSAGPAGTAIFGADRATERLLDDVGDDRGLTFRPLRGALPARERIEKVPRFRVLYNPGNAAGQTDFWPLEQLGFEADLVSVNELNTAASDPLAGYDLLFNSAVGYPSEANAVARNRLQAFFAGGGGFIGGQSTGADFLRNASQAPGLTAAFRRGRDTPQGQSFDGYSGIVLWANTSGRNSVITGAYPATDTAIADPPTWLTGVPSTMTVDATFVTGDFFLSGLFPGWESSGAAGAPIIAHGTNTANTARLTVFANNPLYRADPEREWPMVGSAAYWGDN
jgi:hypothetical protein